MCVISTSRRKRNVMNIDMFRAILKRFMPYRKDLEYVSLVGCGETLLDKSIVQKVEILKEMGFRGIGFPTNCTELSELTSESLIRAGLNTLICSIDGFTKDTHEFIRAGTDFDEVVSNVRRFIEVRNRLLKEESLKTKVIIRFIYQNKNKSEWIDFYNYWMPFLNKTLGDDVIKQNIHNHGNRLKDYEKSVQYSKYVCKSLFERIIILSDGNMIFCCGDNEGEYYSLKNVIDNDNDPIEIFNDETRNHYRKLMLDGRIHELKYCSECTIPQACDLEWMKKNRKEN
jgi:molybdenum cofactor biosynthesis enzyme MoaA